MGSDLVGPTFDRVSQFAVPSTIVVSQFDVSSLVMVPTAGSALSSVSLLSFCAMNELKWCGPGISMLNTQEFQRHLLEEAHGASHQVEDVGTEPISLEILAAVVQVSLIVDTGGMLEGRETMAPGQEQHP
ncbi:hypothetical protein WISP_01177 [Willisornis vidua]|uniref:Uncharacterized protein n=1 Tax=Willisornis vidua TaxID=1566151 RepID=A0ABQ9DVV2_9PASS|nr:hypothetical protein WISP_01177 [Willisornis vidua]